MESVRILGPGDEALLLAFLTSHPDTTLFMQSNLVEGGLLDGGKRFQATYAGVVRGADLVGVVAHCWNGMLLVEASTGREAALRAACAGSGRGVSGFAGPWEQVESARTLLGLREAATTLDAPEILYALGLEEVRVPAALQRGAVTARRAEEADLAVLCPWSVDYHLESIRQEAGATLEAEVEVSARSGIERRSLWIAEAGGQPVAMTRFNAMTPDVVQVGGVYTPPALRSRGYAACAVAQSLLDARADGASRSILFTPEENVPAQRCYEGLGYEPIGHYGLVLFKDEHPFVG